MLKCKNKKCKNKNKFYKIYICKSYYDEYHEASGNEEILMEFPSFICAKCKEKAIDVEMHKQKMQK